MKRFVFKFGFTVCAFISVLILLGACDMNEDAKGNIRGRVTDALQNTGVQGARIEILDEEFGAVSNTDGNYEIKDIPEGVFSVRATATDYIDVTKSSVQVFSNETTPLSFQLLRAGEVGNLSGLVTSATTGRLIADVTISVIGFDISTITDDNGYYMLRNVPAGTRTVAASASFYYTNHIDGIEIKPGETSVANFTLSPDLSQTGGIMRIVLTWGEEPHDLDSHLKTPEIEGQRHHIYWDAKGDSAHAPYVWLDIDDVSSFGPETITIYRPFAGVYQYFVHNYSQFVDEEAPNLTASGGMVQIYDRSGLRQTFRIPGEGDGLFWYVCDIDLEVNNIIEINRIQIEEPGGGESFSAIIAK
jgi:hypothetical protein